MSDIFPDYGIKFKLESLSNKNDKVEVVCFYGGIVVKSYNKISKKTNHISISSKSAPHLAKMLSAIYSDDE